MKKLQTYGTIEDGKLKIIHRNRFTEAIKALKPGRYSLTIEKVYRKRSNPQNSFLWGVVYPIVLEGLKQAGFEEFEEDEQVHDLLKCRFLKKDIVNKDGEVIETVGMTKNLTTTEFMDYLSEIGKWSSEYLNVYIPEPGEQTEIKFEDNEPN